MEPPGGLAGREVCGGFDPREGCLSQERIPEATTNTIFELPSSG